MEEGQTYCRQARESDRSGRIGIEKRSVLVRSSIVEKSIKMVFFRRKFARSSGDLIEFGEISLDLVRFPQDLAEISLNPT